MDPAFADPERNQGDDAERGRGGKALKVFGLAVGVFGHAVGSDVEAGETKKAAESKRGEEEMVEGGSHTDCDGCGGGRDTEGDLWKRVAISGVDEWIEKKSIPGLQASRAPGP